MRKNPLWAGWLGRLVGVAGSGFFRISGFLGRLFRISGFSDLKQP